MKWQPIETAPKDGSDILVWCSRGVQMAAYFDLLGIWEMPATADYDNDYATLENVTHWMPLPEPPENT